MHVAIIGNGVTGITAALRIRERRSDWRITVISGESKYHYARPALMYVFMGHMRYEDTKPYEDSFWAEKGIDLVRGWVSGIDTEMSFGLFGRFDDRFRFRVRWSCRGWHFQRVVLGPVLEQVTSLIGGRWRNRQRGPTAWTGRGLVVSWLAHSGLARRAPHRCDLRRGWNGGADILGMPWSNARSVHQGRPR